MDLRRSAMYLLVVMICWNASCTILEGAGIGMPVTPGFSDIDALPNRVNATVYDYSPDPAFNYGNFVAGMVKFFDVIGSVLLYGAPAMLLSMDIPDFIVTPLLGVWAFIWFAIITLYWIGGREL